MLNISCANDTCRCRTESRCCTPEHCKATVLACQVALVVSGCLQPCELQPARLLCLWYSPGKNTGADCHAFLQGIFPAQGSNPHLLHLLHCGFFTTSAIWETQKLYSSIK